MLGVLFVCVVVVVFASARDVQLLLVLLKWYGRALPLISKKNTQRRAFVFSMGYRDVQYYFALRTTFLLKCVRV
jgi:hypothetical protein